MRRYYLKKGDQSSAGGVVLEGEETYTHQGIAMTYLGAKVYCPTCKTTGVIVGQGPRLPYAMMSREAALDGDICVCNCKPSPVMTASQNDSYQELNRDEIRLTPRADQSVSPYSASATPSPNRYSQSIFVYDSVTGEPLKNRRFIASVEGEQRSGKTNANGYAHLETDGSAEFRIHIVFSSPRRELVPGPGA
ncbi:PAAR domain-containing protein [Burkholderia sp. WSM2230]|uniref:PAAR domain-containing protein n=1 Tax=Burkholderia sp. WSM2230 TaxID=944435 RepID=UPI000472E0C9|nr:PAAR domain-containing protein [Burkholderia sp. WSM2230]